MFRHFAAALALALVLIPATVAAQDDDDSVLVARPAGHALLIWDATPAVVDIVKKKLSTADADAALERGALAALASNRDGLGKPLIDVTVNVVFKKIGAINPEYGTPTYAGVYHYATLTMAAKDVTGNRDKWTALAATAALPTWVGFTTSGQLPPR